MYFNKLDKHDKLIVLVGLAWYFSSDNVYFYNKLPDDDRVAKTNEINERSILRINCTNDTNVSKDFDHKSVKRNLVSFYNKNIILKSCSITNLIILFEKQKRR